MGEIVMDPNRVFSKPAEVQPRVDADVAFKTAVERGADDAKATIRKNFESNPNQENNLDYHCNKHTEAVIGRTDQILEAIGANERIRGLGKLAADMGYEPH